ncbi:MFS transporter, partial [Arthrobacter deserti]|nr:MFS transporter [Arthrobacter deserti]
LLEHFWWGSVFLLAVPVLAAMLVLTPLFVPESKDPKPGRIDVPGIALSVLAMLPLVYAIKNLANEGSPAVTAATAGLGILAGWLFARRQLRRPDPMLDVRLFRVRPFAGAVLVNLLAIFALVGFLYFVSQHLQLVLGLSPLAAGAVLLPGLAVTIAAGFTAVPLVRRVAPNLVVSAALLL